MEGRGMVQKVFINFSRKKVGNLSCFIQQKSNFLLKGIKGRWSNDRNQCV